MTTIKCSSCGRFFFPFDSETPFGCDDPESPEPLDPYFYCEGCFQRLKKYYVDYFKRGGRSGQWEESFAEQSAAKECGLEWVHDSGKSGYKDIRSHLSPTP